MTSCGEGGRAALQWSLVADSRRSRLVGVGLRIAPDQQRSQQYHRDQRHADQREQRRRPITHRPGDDVDAHHRGPISAGRRSGGIRVQGVGERRPDRAVLGLIRDRRPVEHQDVFNGATAFDRQVARQRLHRRWIHVERRIVERSGLAAESARNRMLDEASLNVPVSPAIGRPAPIGESKPVRCSTVISASHVSRLSRLSPDPSASTIAASSTPHSTSCARPRRGPPHVCRRLRRRIPTP